MKKLSTAEKSVERLIELGDDLCKEDNDTDEECEEEVQTRCMPSMVSGGGLTRLFDEVELIPVRFMMRFVLSRMKFPKICNALLNAACCHVSFMHWLESKSI